MKKQLFRVKQFADQALSRNEKTNEFPDDLNRADLKTEYIKNTCHNVAKKMSGFLLMPTAGTEGAPQPKDRKEKALKKVPEYALAIALGESCDPPPSYDSPLKTSVEECCKTEHSLVAARLELDNNIDTHVYAKFISILEKEVPSIAKLKRTTQKICLDRDAAKQRYFQATKQGNTTAAAKLDVIRDELEDCESKLEQSQDALACEMFQFIVKEGELCHDLLQFYKHRRSYHQHAIEEIDRLIPSLESVANRSVRKIFGTRLEDHLEMENRRIAFPIELCVCLLHTNGMEEEGIFRLAGGASKLKRMKLSLDAGCMSVPAALNQDPHVIAGCLKSYLRDLPEPLLTYALYDKWLSAVNNKDEQERLELLKQVVNELPERYLENLKYLIRFFRKLSEHQDVNKMSPQNLAIVLAPNLIWMPQDKAGICLNALNTTAYYSRIVELLVTYSEYFFPGEFKIFDSLNPESFCNGDSDGIDNKGFDMRTQDAESGMKRSQSVNSLADEQHGSPKPVMRKKNKPAAPHPPGEKEKPPRPAVGPTPTVAATATMPRNRVKVQKETKATETDENMMTQSMGSAELLMLRSGERSRTRNDIEVKPRTSLTKESQTPDELVHDPKPPIESEEEKHNGREAIVQARKNFLECKPAIPAKPAMKTFNRNTISSLDGAKYENVGSSSNENLSGDERTLQHTKFYSTDKKQVATIIQVDKKRDRSRDKISKEKDDSVEQKNGELEASIISEDKKKEDGVPLSNKPEPKERTVSLSRASSLSDSRRPISLSVTGSSERPERPPKPEQFKPSPSHTRTSSEGNIIDRPSPTARREFIAVDGMKSVIKHPSTSPPPPPVAKIETPTNDSTDF